MSTAAHRSLKRVLDPLELELEAVVSHPTWMHMFLIAETFFQFLKLLTET